MKTYRYKWKQWTSSSCGPPAVIEDFVPDKRCLVSAGSEYRKLTMVVSAEWEIRNNTVLLWDEEIEDVGNYLRLGHWRNGKPVCSDGWEGPHQPFIHDSGLWYTHDAPTARIYCNGSVAIDWWGEYVEVGNPWIHDNRLYFEARKDDNAAPQGWELWSSTLKGDDKKFICFGANPAVWEGQLYYSIWCDDHFELATAPLG